MDGWFGRSSDKTNIKTKSNNIRTTVLEWSVVKPLITTVKLSPSQTVRDRKNCLVSLGHPQTPIILEFSSDQNDRSNQEGA